MSAPRRNLKVDTFPFLAVLLCAMGALIIVLLTMDRKAHRAAKAKAEAAAHQQSDDRDAQIAAHQRDHDRRKAEIHAAWLKKHDALKTAVDAEGAALDAELREVRARLAAASRRLNAELDTLRAARTRLADEREKLTAAEAALAAAQNQAGGEIQRLSATEAARARLAINLESMERTLRELEADRKRDTNTYSLIPYRGKRGSNQKPIYVECAAAGLIFHPDRKLVPTDDLKAVRAEVTRRFVTRGGEPYLMLLVRPDGIEPYYRIRSSVSDLDITFGYEMVDAEWQFHVPDEPATPGPATVTVPPMPPKKRPGGDGVARLMPPGMSGEGGAKGGLSASVNLQRPRPFGAEEGSAPLNPDAPLPGAIGLVPGGTGRAGMPSREGEAPAEPRGPFTSERAVGGNPGGSASAGTAPSQDVASPAPLFGGTFGPGGSSAPPHPDAPLPGGRGSGATGGAAGSGGTTGFTSGGRGAGPTGPPPTGGTPPGGEGGEPMPPVIDTNPRPSNPYLSADAKPSDGAGTPSTGGTPSGTGAGSPGGEAGDPGPSAPRPSNPYRSDNATQSGPPIARSGPAEDGPRLPELPEATIRPKPRVEREPLRHARIDSNEVTVFVECCADYVVVYPGRKVVTRDALATGTLLAHVKKGLARPLLGGGTPKPQVRFLVRPEGERTFHDANDVLRAVNVPKIQYKVQPEDDVARLVGSR